MNAPSIYEYLPEHAEALWKFAETAKPEREPAKRPLAHAVKAFGGGLASMAVGNLAGLGASMLGARLYERATGKKIQFENLAIPAAVLGTGLGLAHRMYKAHELEELQHAWKSHRNKSKRSDPGQ